MIAQSLFLFSGFLFVAVSLKVGDECMTKTHEVGQCMKIQKCDMLYTLVKEISNKTVDYDRYIKILQVEACGVGQLVCCSLSVGDVSSRFNAASFDYNPLLPDRSSCGFQTFDRIIGGNDTGLSEFPWMVLLEYRQQNGGSVPKCGGFLINNRYVLTAAHCARQTVTDRLSKVRLGEWDTSKDIDCLGGTCNEEPVEVGLEEIIVHPDYEPSSENQHNDIALLRMRRTVEFNDFIKPICLPIQPESYLSGSHAWVSGWGHTEHSSFSTKKQKVRLPIVANPYCKFFYRNVAKKIGDTQICAGGNRTQDSCNGDSGGPLMTTAANDSSQWYVRGIVSYGPLCGLTDYPAVYTRVSTYLKWIHENVRE